MWRMVASMVSSVAAAVMTRLPSRKTVTRSESAKISSRRCETNRIATPCDLSWRAIEKRRSTSRAESDAGLGDFDQLLIGDGETANRCGGREGGAQRRKERGNLTGHPAAIDATEPVGRLATHEDVFGDIQVGVQGWMLVDDGDAVAARV